MSSTLALNTGFTSAVNYHRLSTCQSDEYFSVRLIYLPMLKSCWNLFMVTRYTVCGKPLSIAALLKADLSYIFRDHAMCEGEGRSCHYLDEWIHILQTVCCYGSHMAKQIVMPCLDNS